MLNVILENLKANLTKTNISEYKISCYDVTKTEIGHIIVDFDGLLLKSISFFDISNMGDKTPYPNVRCEFFKDTIVSNSVSIKIECLKNEIRTYKLCQE